MTVGVGPKLLGVVALVAMAALVGTACSGPPPVDEPVATASLFAVEPDPTEEATATPTATTAAELTIGSLRIDVPAGWRFYPRHAASTFSSLMGYLSTVEVDEPCSVDRTTESCDRTPYELTPGSAVVSLGTYGEPTDRFAEPPAGVTVSDVDGMPAYRTVEASETPDAARFAWWVAIPDTTTNYYTFTAEILGPSEAVLTETVDALVEGVRFDDPVEILPTDAASRDAAAAVALAELREDSEAFACMPPVAGEVAEATVAGLPQNWPPAGPLAVSCSYTIAPTPRQLWRMDIRFEWEAKAGRPAGALLIDALLGPDGSVLGQGGRLETTFD